MKKKIYQIENESRLGFSVQRTLPFINNGKEKRMLPSQVAYSGGYPFSISGDIRSVPS